jgi:hypothetical protein
MIWRILIAALVFLISIAGLLLTGNRLLDLFNKIFEKNRE